MDEKEKKSLERLRKRIEEKHRNYNKIMEEEFKPGYCPNCGCEMKNQNEGEKGYPAVFACYNCTEYGIAVFKEGKEWKIHILDD